MDIRRLIAELKGRGVYRVAAIYAAACWALLQIADVFFPILGLPDWAITGLLAAAALGFPLALVVAWIFEITPEGIVETDATGASFGEVSLSPVRIVELGLLLTLVCLVGFLYLERLAADQAEPAPDHRPADGSERPSIAVMAFENMSDDPSVDYFGDGLAEEILNLLARINELDVAARSSSFYYKGREIDLREVGSRLGVAHVLEGSVRRAGDRVRITAQLVELATGYNAWSETWERDFSDTFSIQEEIARQVVDSLQVVLSDHSLEILNTRPTLDPQAYDFYLRGRDYLRRSSSRDNLDSAVTLFERALALDPQFKAAYAGLCDVYLELYRLELDPGQFERAQSACESALTLEGDSLPVHVALGNLYRLSGRYDEAITQFSQALTENPDSVDALDGLGHTYRMDGKPEQAARMFERAIRLQPGFWRGYMSMGTLLYNAGRFAEAEPYHRRITELMPDNAQALNSLGATCYLQGKVQQAAEAWERSIEIEPTALAYANAGSALFFQGRFGEAADMYKRAVEYAPSDFEHWGSLGDAYRYGDAGSQGLAEAMYARALSMAQERLAVNPQDAVTLSLVAYYEAALGRREAALQHSASAIALSPEEMYVHYNNALTLTTLKELDRAAESLSRAVELGYSVDLVRLDAGFSELLDAGYLDAGEPAGSF